MDLRLSPWFEMALALTCRCVSSHPSRVIPDSRRLIRDRRAPLVRCSVGLDSGSPLPALHFVAAGMTTEKKLHPAATTSAVMPGTRPLLSG